MPNKKNFHWLFIVAAMVIVSGISIAPHIAFWYSLGDEYRGVYMMATANETEYLARTQEVRDGHFQLGSVPIFEYKDSPFVMPPSIYDFLIVGISWLLSISVISATIASKAMLPAILFLAIYLFIQNIAGIGSKNATWLGIAGGFLVIFGYDLIDFRTILNYLAGSGSLSGAFLLWTRPMNPVLGGILLFALLLILWKLNQANKCPRTTKGGNITSGGEVLLILGGALLVTAMIMSYYFSWTFAFALGGALGIINILRRRWFFVWRLLAIYVLGTLFTMPYWINIYYTLQSPWYSDMALRVGAFWGHMPIINKFVLAGTILFVVFSLLRRLAGEWENEWWHFCVAILGAGWIVFNQQIITGYTIWPFHYVQYTIPFVIVVVLAAGHRSLGSMLPRFWTAVLVVVASASLTFGIYTQLLAYRIRFDEYRDKQNYGELFLWINQGLPFDCSILSMDDFFNAALPGYTHCNAYLSGFMGQFLIPQDRISHRYMITLRLQGVSTDDIDRYVQERPDEVVGGLYAMGGLVRGVNDPISQEALRRFPDEYRAFLRIPLRAALEQYRIDYILLDEKLRDVIARELDLSGASPLYQKNGFTLYEF